MGTASPYCASRYHSIRRQSHAVRVGDLSVGGKNPIRVQSMTTTDTLDVEATVRQTLELAEAGCEIVRITAPGVPAAEALGPIVREVRAAGYEIPLVADIHFSPRAAMEAAKHVEKVRVNPGNYADRKKFQVREYTDSQYEQELERLHEAFSPLVLRCSELGRSMRIGTNHGSLSDRILNRFGDTPRGMAESALEFVRIARSHGFEEMILSMKASNPKVMIEAYRLVVSLMNEEGMNYPLHLGVTEAGDGEDARIKSAIGIGSLLLDGLGDTIRVSLTEDPVAEIPVARDLVRRAEAWWSDPGSGKPGPEELVDPFSFSRRPCGEISLSGKVRIGDKHPPVVLVHAQHPLEQTDKIISEFARAQSANKDAPIEGLVVHLEDSLQLPHLQVLMDSLVGAVPSIFVEDSSSGRNVLEADEGSLDLVWLSSTANRDAASLASFLHSCETAGAKPALSLSGSDLSLEIIEVLSLTSSPPIITLADKRGLNPVAGYRALAALLGQNGLDLPLWIRNFDRDRLFPEDQTFSSRLLDSSILTGSLLCDGIGDLLSVEDAGDLDRNRGLAYNILQGARARISKTEFVACPSCGRTLFDLQSTTKKVKQATDHLKGVTIAVMGCIVNGPGEMADADFGYVGSGPGKIDLYVGKDRVTNSIDEAEAVDRLVDLIKEEGKWIDR